MSKDSWKPGLPPYARGSCSTSGSGSSGSGTRSNYPSGSSGSGSRNNYTSWSSSGWHGGGQGSRSSGSNMPWQPENLNSMGTGSSGYYMPYGTVGWYATAPMESSMAWGTAGWYTDEQVAWRPETRTSGSRVGVPTNSEQGSNSKKPNKKVSLDAALRTPAPTGNGPTQAEREPVSGRTETTHEEPQEIVEEVTSMVPPVPVRTYYPDPIGMRSRPYPVTEGRPYPQLEEGKEIYQSEQGRGTYPFSIVPRFSDVIKYEGFPVTPTPPWVDPKDKPVHKPEVWRKAYASKLIRQHEERRAFFERTTLPNPEAYPWAEWHANMKDGHDMTPF
eukprot:3499328-Amphidinium_carterae.3